MMFASGVLVRNCQVLGLSETASVQLSDRILERSGVEASRDQVDRQRALESRVALGWQNKFRLIRFL